MARGKHQLTIRIPIPSALPPSSVVDALQSFTPVIRHQALVTRFQQTHVSLEDVLGDDFFGEDGTRIACFRVYEKITLIPGLWSREISFPVIFQRSGDGIRFRTQAPAGVTLWGDYTVRRKTQQPQGLDSGDGPFEVVEDITVQCNSLLLPFVKGQMEHAHREICEKIVQESLEKLQETTTQFGQPTSANYYATQEQNDARGTYSSENQYDNTCANAG